jgi:hypothetical protein
MFTMTLIEQLDNITNEELLFSTDDFTDIFNILEYGLNTVNKPDKILIKRDNVPLLFVYVDQKDIVNYNRLNHSVKTLSMSPVKKCK